MGHIVVLKGMAGDLTGQQFTFEGPSSCVLGRSRSCTVRLPTDATVSRQHCMLEVSTEGVWVQDLGSLNGTFLNGERIGKRELRDGDETMVQPPRQSLHDGDILRICNNVFTVRLVNNLAEATRKDDSESKMAMCG